MVDTSSLILVNGSPASGKTRLAGYLSAELRMPLVAKDAIKERLHDTLGGGDREWSSRLGRAAYALLYEQIEALLRVGASAVVDAPLSARYEQGRLEALIAQHDASAVQVLLVADRAVLAERYRARGASDERHAAHEVTEEDVARLGLSEPFALPGRTVTVDTTDFTTVRYEAILASVRGLLAGGR